MLLYWYHTTRHICPICGCVKSFRERRVNPKPTKYTDLYKEMEVYDGCQGY